MLILVELFSDSTPCFLLHELTGLYYRFQLTYKRLRIAVFHLCFFNAPIYVKLLFHQKYTILVMASSLQQTMEKTMAIGVPLSAGWRERSSVIRTYLLLLTENMDVRFL